MRLLPGLAMTIALLMGTSVGVAAEYRDAREQFPAAMLGLWKVDMAASTYEGNKPKAALRTFQYTEGGKVLVTFMTLNSAGVYSTGHWAAQIDGGESIEYHSRSGSIPYNVVRLNKVDDKNLKLVVLRHGQKDIEATYNLSDDGKTLTYSFGKNVIVYKKWEQMDW